MANNEDKTYGKSKVPKIDGNNWLFYELRLSTFIGSDKWASVKTECPRAMDALTPEDQALFDATLNAHGNETARSRAWITARGDAIKEWKTNSEFIYKVLIESCEDNDSAKLICLKVYQGSAPTAKTLWDALCKKYNDQDRNTTTNEVGIFNTMTIQDGETRGQWIDRLTKQIISLEGRGRRVNEELRVERLLSGLHANKEYKIEAANIALQDKGGDWDYVTGILIGYDKRDLQDKGKQDESAHYGGGDFQGNCHHCHQKGHKRPNCPELVRSTRLGSKGYGGRGRGHGGKGNNGGRGGGGKGKKRQGKRACNICGKNGHFASDCNETEAFRQFMRDNKKRKSQRQHQKKTEGYDSESSCMIQEVALVTRNMSKSGCLDSGCTSHSLDSRAIPSDVKIDSTLKTTIKTAKAGEHMHTLGRANAGLLQSALVLPPGTLNENLISLPSLDNTGHITVLGNGEGLIYKGGTVTVTGGTLVARAPLDGHTNLYQLKNIQSLIQPREQEVAMLGSALIKEDIDLWHRRLGHRSKRSIIKFRNEGRIRGISRFVKLTAKNQGICEPCARTKSTRHRFSRRPPNKQPTVEKQHSKLKPHTTKQEEPHDSESDEEEEEPLIKTVSKIISEAKPLNKVISKISTDIKGPFAVPGTSGEIYYQGFIEADTKYHRCYFSKNKNESVEHTDHLWNTVLKSEGSTCTTYQSDGAPELISKDIIKLLSKNETKLMYSPAYTPELNSVIERNHNTIFESGHAMLVESNKPLMFYVEAI